MNTKDIVQKREKCLSCNGDGYTAEHDPNDMRPEHYEDGDCQSCPVKVYCEECKGNGYFTIKDINT